MSLETCITTSLSDELEMFFVSNPLRAMVKSLKIMKGGMILLAMKTAVLAKEERNV